MSTNELIQRASMGTITTEELSSVARSLEQREGDAYDNLLILGRAGAKQFRELIHKFLNYEVDPMLARLALQVLCRYWGLAGEYASEITAFVSGVDWDEDEDVRIMAISCSDSLIASYKHRELLALVYRIATDVNERNVVRQAAYEALAISCGIKPSDLPSPVRFKVDRDMDPKILEEVKSRILG